MHKDVPSVQKLQYITGLLFGVLVLLSENKNSFQNSIKISIGFWSGFCTICDQFWEYFEDLESSKMVFSCRRGAIFEKITFFRSDKVLDGYFHDF